MKPRSISPPDTFCALEQSSNNFYPASYSSVPALILQADTGCTSPLYQKQDSSQFSLSGIPPLLGECLVISIATKLPRKISRILMWLMIVLLFLTPIAYADEEQTYSYQLEQGKGKDVCEHMTKVFNSNFKQPWNVERSDANINPLIFGKSLDQTFERLPGVDYNKRFALKMLLSKYPSSPEFEAVPWKDGRICWVAGKQYPNCDHIGTDLIVELDINNDGHKEWLVKSLFLTRKPTSNDKQFPEADDLTIFPESGFDPAQLITEKELAYGQKDGYLPKKLGMNIDPGYSTFLLRPFVYKDRIFLAAYQTSWKKNFTEKNRSKSREWPLSKS